MIPPDRVTLPADAMLGQSVVALYFEDLKPLEGPAALLDWRLDGQLTRMLLDGQVSGRAGEHVLLQNNGKLKADWVLFVGGGKWHGLCKETHAALIRHLLSVVRQAGFKEISIALMPHPELSDDDLQRQISDALDNDGNVSLCCHFNSQAAGSV